MSIATIGSAYSSATWGVPPVAPVTSISAGDSSSAGSPATSDDSSMLDVLTQALQALGVDTSTSDTSATESTSTDSDDSASANNQGLDLSLFMNSLFGAMNDTDTLLNSTSQSPGTEISQSTGNTFTDGLSSLLTQIGSGDTPPALQSSFDTMMSSVGGTGESTPSMSDLLSRMQQQAQSSNTYGDAAPSSLFLNAYA